MKYQIDDFAIVFAAAYPHASFLCTSVPSKPIKSQNWPGTLENSSLKKLHNRFCERCLYLVKQMLLIPNAFTKFFTRKKLLPTSAGNAQAQLHFRDINRGRLKLTSPIEPILALKLLFIYKKKLPRLHFCDINRGRLKLTSPIEPILALKLSDAKILGANGGLPPGR